MDDYADEKDALRVGDVRRSRPMIFYRPIRADRSFRKFARIAGGPIGPRAAISLAAP